MTTQPQQHRCYLLKLPKELRLQIYEILLKPAKLEIRSSDRPQISGLSHDRIQSDFFVAPLQPSLHPRILQSCNKINGEASTILYSHAYLHLRRSWRDVDELIARPFDLARLQSVHRLDKLQIHLLATVTWVENEIAHSAILRQFMHRDLFARCVLITIDKELDMTRMMRTPFCTASPLWSGLGRGPQLATTSRCACVANGSIRPSLVVGESAGMRSGKL